MDDLQVLIVDDEDVAVTGHSAYVGRIPGFGVAGTARTKQDALRFLGSARVDLVLLDLNLPDGHGLEIARAIRTANHPADVMAITAAREIELVRAAVSLGGVGYLLKPFTFADLRDRLESYRRYREGLDSSDAASQSGVDAIFRELRRPVLATDNAPKGLVGGVLDTVIAALRAGGSDGLSASQVGDEVGVSRVTARRYLQYLADSGRAQRGQRLGGSGRPEVTYTWDEP
ncbi:response regulator [Georgenia sp. Z1344]|uniref:response regulator n=1 Tax=Georgenia sp. Z1344 TaxID=3416706 RepID=UPI003CF0A88B